MQRYLHYYSYHHHNLYQGKKKKTAKGNLSLPARTPIAHKLSPPELTRADIHLPAAFSTHCIVHEIQSTKGFGVDAIFYNYCKHELNNGNKILFPSSFAFK